jgi:hypothetical protein
VYNFNIDSFAEITTTEDSLFSWASHVSVGTELKALQQLATAELRWLYVIEVFMCIVCLGIVCLFIKGLLLLVRMVGWYLKINILAIKHGPTREEDADEIMAKDALQKIKERSVDVFFSCDESYVHLAREVQKSISKDLNMFIGPRDVPPGVPELSALSVAIGNSRKFVILLTAEYLETQFFELEMIVNTAQQIGGRRWRDCVLVLRFDGIMLPTMLRGCRVRNWATCHPEYICGFEFDKVIHWIRDSRINVAMADIEEMFEDRAADVGLPIRTFRTFIHRKINNING